jgi:hypothetical protein
VQQLVARIEQSAGPPPGVSATGIQLLFDESQATALALQLFETAEDMRKGDEVFGAMDPADTPGTRVSVDMCQLKLKLERYISEPDRTAAV